MLQLLTFSLEPSCRARHTIVHDSVFDWTYSPMTPERAIFDYLLQRSPKLVVFDLDDTLLQGNTFSHWAQFLTEEGMVSSVSWKLREKWMLFQYRLGMLNFDGFIKATVAPYQDWDPKLLSQRIQTFLNTRLSHYLYEEGISLVRSLQARGTPIVVITASNALFVRPFLRQTLNIDYVAATELEVHPDGRLTGHVAGRPPYQAGKIEVLKPYLEHFQAQWRDVAFCSDSFNDLPLLEKVGTPIAINPDKRLARHAQNHHWMHAQFQTTKSPRV